MPVCLPVNMAQETKPQRNARLLNAVKGHACSSAVAWNLLRELPASCLSVCVGNNVSVRPVRDDLMDTVKHTDNMWSFYASKYTDTVWIEALEEHDIEGRDQLIEWADVVRLAKCFKPMTDEQVSATKFGLIEVLDDMTFADQKVFARMRCHVLIGITDAMTVEEFQEHVWSTKTPQEWVLFLHKNPLTHMTGEEE